MVPCLNSLLVTLLLKKREVDGFFGLVMGMKGE
jgi:hypothetical protein